MRSHSFTLYLAMLFSSGFWAVYGVGLAGRAAHESNCTSCIVQSTTTRAFTLAPQASPFQTPLSASWHTLSSTRAPRPSSKVTTFPPVPIATHSSHDSHNNSFAILSTGAKAGIIVGISLFFLGVFLVLLELGYLRRKRRERALRRAVEEVERGGIRMGKSVGSESSESKENMVLESRVEIIVDDSDGSDGDDAWDADMEDEERGKTAGWGRQAMSLPRREY
ncbi:uncharacterized protein K460DRAFT_413338 [Cucurbitaria berberidis CBS 394.84]|uniref:Uncharacterized protein n=1 Tax=Cucurbitaria berberidis CBS 394.84 TaxID=1168544 RepID=A0A9P4GV14_9PLEO|nr:uncharacterized protein K460DRAFT_413338 [Cucurbitaria berberidis CBS 394.84]KAF1851832.1 hypothetical protein K460DRAFT_413338 [Cucurbitaria berberidis CBS 394.84]